MVLSPSPGSSSSGSGQPSLNDWETLLREVTESELRPPLLRDDGGSPNPHRPPKPATRTSSSMEPVPHPGERVPNVALEMRKVQLELEALASRLGEGTPGAPASASARPLALERARLAAAAGTELKARLEATERGIAERGIVARSGGELPERPVTPPSTPPQPVRASAPSPSVAVPHPLTTKERELANGDGGLVLYQAGLPSRFLRLEPGGSTIWMAHRLWRVVLYPYPLDASVQRFEIRFQFRLPQDECGGITVDGQPPDEWRKENVGDGLREPPPDERPSWRLPSLHVTPRDHFLRRSVQAKAMDAAFGATAWSRQRYVREGGLNKEVVRPPSRAFPAPVTSCPRAIQPVPPSRRAHPHPHPHAHALVCTP